jgi:hypothetical protein
LSGGELGLLLPQFGSWHLFRLLAGHGFRWTVLPLNWRNSTGARMRRPTARNKDDEDEHAHRMTVNLVAAIVCLLLFGAGLFVAEGLSRSNKAQACLEAGRRTCPSLPSR